MARPDLTATQLALYKIFSVDYQLEIPVYQRPYSWSGEQTLQLVDDLLGALDRDDPVYFLGSIVLIRNQDDERRFEVVDGQQRLVTLAVLIAALRNLVDDDGLRASLDGMLREPGNKARSIPAGPRLLLADADRSFFEEFIGAVSLDPLFDLVSEDLASDTQRRIYENAKALYDVLADETEQPRLEALTRFLVNRVALVTIVSDSPGSAFRIFNVLNTRGVPLTASDILKSRILGSIGVEDRAEYARRWERLRDVAADGADRDGGLDAVLRHTLALLAHRTSVDNLIEDFSEHVLRRYEPDTRGQDANGTDAHGPGALIDDELLPNALALATIRSPDTSRAAPDVVAALRRLASVPTREWGPVAIWVLRHLGATEAVRAVSLLDALERVCTVDQLAGRTPTQRRTRIEQLLRTLADAERDLLADAERSTAERSTADRSTADRDTRERGARERDTRERDTVLAAIGHSRGFAIDDDERRRALMHLRGEMTVRGRLTQLLLERTNAALAERPLPAVRTRHVVRVLPTLVSDPSWRTLSGAQRAYWADRIANLVLAGRSERAFKDIASFPDRAAALGAGPGAEYPLTRELAEIPTWTEAALQDRENRIVRTLAELLGIRTDSAGLDLTTLTGDELAGGSPDRRARRRPRTLDIVRSGLIAPGDAFVWNRADLGTTYRVTVNGLGQFVLPNGSTSGSPTGAARALGGSGGIDVWRRESDGKALRDIWNDYATGTGRALAHHRRDDRGRDASA